MTLPALQVRDVGSVFLGSEFEALQELNMDCNALVEVSGEFRHGLPGVAKIVGREWYPINIYTFLSAQTLPLPHPLRPFC